MFKLDLRTDLAKVTPDIIALAGNSTCRYTAPCAVGAMLTPEQRQQIDAADCDIISVRALARGENGKPKLFDIPADQIADFTSLQVSFDRTTPTRFGETLALLKEKYAV